MSRRAAWLAGCTVFLLAAGSPGGRTAAAQNLIDARVYDWSRTAVLGELLRLPESDVAAALQGLERHGRTDIVPTLILALHFNRAAAPRIGGILAALTGERKAATWFEWALWQESHAEIRPHPSFARVKTELLSRIDPEFARFVPLSPDAEIRLEEVVWGGVVVDGIPALDNPPLVTAAEADYLIPGELVFGVEINGDARAYPLRIMDWHEMLNDVVGGVPVALAYCTLCGSGILYDTRLPGLAEPLVFATSGLLYRSNKLMYDRQTASLWNQFTGRPVSGPLAGSGVALVMLPVAIASWRDWRARHPATRVLSLDTGFSRDYTPEAAYGHYFDSPDLMFPALADASRLKRKDFIFGVRTAGGAKAWPIEAFRATPVINDAVGLIDVVVVGDALTRTARAFRRDGRTFAAGSSPDALIAGGETWRVTEAGLESPSGAKLPRVAGHVAYWFAWSSYLGADAALFDPAAR